MKRRTPQQDSEQTGAVVEVQVRRLDAPLAWLHVMVLPWGTNSVGIYRVADPLSTNTWNVGGPPAAEIIDDLNRAFRQACVRFTLATNATTQIEYDRGRNNNRYAWNGAFDDCETRLAEPLMDADDRWVGNCRLFIFKEQGSGQHPAREQANAWPPKWGFVCNEAPGYERSSGERWNPMWGIRHEIGHCYGLSVRVNARGAHHDNGPPPPGTDMLMREGHPNPEPIWMRHEDWKEANRTAKRRSGQ